MNKLKVWTGIVLVFVVGALAGSLATGLYFKHRIGRFAEGRRPPVKALLLKKLSHQLDLTEKQRVEIEEILEELQVKLNELKRNRRPELEKAFDHSFGLIQEKLNAEQKRKFDEIREKLRKRRPAREKRDR